jgi:hypothetical protein
MNAIVCAFCGTRLADAKPVGPQPSKVPLRVLGLVCCAAVGIAIFYPAKKSEPTTVEQEQVVASPPLANQNAIPQEQNDFPASNIKFSPKVAITPWQLIHNPFALSRKVALLHYRMFPILYNGTLLDYTACNDVRFCTVTNTLGIRFDRMIAPDKGMYDVMGEESRSGVGPGSEGQIIVELAERGEPPPLTLSEWLVMPVDPTQGTNGFGAPVSIPTVRFIRVATPDDLGIQTAPDHNENAAQQTTP